jgi:capsular polysaccharide biosynthesis protein
MPSESEKPRTMKFSMDYSPRGLKTLDSHELEFQQLCLDSIEDKQAFEKLVGSLRKRWWFYCIVTLLAGGIGYATSSELGSYSYQASSLVRTKPIPFPPGQAFYTAPRIEDFVKYLSEPEVVNTLIKDFGFAGPPERLFEHELDLNKEIVTVKLAADRPETAAEMVNQLVGRAIDKSTEQRMTMLAGSLNYFRSLVEKAEAEASSQRQAKVQQLSALRRRLVDDGKAQMQYEELTEVISLRRSELSAFESELKDSQRLLEILEQDERALVSKIQDELKADCLHQIELMAQQFTVDSPPANELERKAEAVKSIAKNGLKNRDELSDWLRSIAVVTRIQLSIPVEHQAALDRIVENLYELKNRLLLLPDKIEETKRTLALATQQRALLTIGDEFNLENMPEIQELSILITRAEQNAEQIAAAITWIEDFQTLDNPAYEQLVPASAQSTVQDGNHHKLFVLAFGTTGLLLGFPLLLLDLLYIRRTAAQKLGSELGLATIATHELLTRTSRKASLQVGDPELRLLALRIQQMAREARGSVVLFSSLADHISTKELTTTLAQCLAARQERVLIIDLESIQENRFQRTSRRQRKTSAKPTRTLRVASSTSPPTHGSALSPVSGELVRGDGHSLGSRKMGLALALSGEAKVPEDVMIEHGDDGVDRVLLGSGELPLEAFASPLMGQLLDTYRNAYSMVLLSGPAAKHLADVQMLAARCDGTLFVAPEKGDVSQTARRTVVELMENRRVILGLAEVPG